MMASRGPKKARPPQTSRQAERRVRHAEEAHARAAEKESSRLTSMSFMRKLKRAEHHINAIDALVTAWRSKGYRITRETNDRGITTEYGQIVNELPEELPLLIGDASQCLFNSLDHLAFAIATKHSGGLTEEEERNSGFPILDKDQSDNRGHNSHRKISRWPPCAISVVGALQPYLGKEEFNAHPLWLLRDLANRDKHRELSIVVFGQFIQNVAIGGPGSGRTYIHHLQTFGANEIGTEPVALVAYSDRNYGDIRLTRNFGIRFGPGPLVIGREVVPTLRWLCDYVERVPVGRLSKFA